MLFGVATLIAILYSIERYFYSRLVGEARLAHATSCRPS